MKTSYYLVAVAGLSAMVAVAYTRLFPGDGPREEPSLPVPADPPSFAAAAPLPQDLNSLPMPPVSVPSDEPLVIPAGGPVLPMPPAQLDMQPPVVPTAAPPLPIPPAAPSIPSAPPPIDPLPLPDPGGLIPPAPGAPPAAPPMSGEPPLLPTSPAPPTRTDTPPALPMLPPPHPNTTTPTPPSLPKPPIPTAPPPSAVPPAPSAPQSANQLPNPTPIPQPDAKLSSGGMFIVLKGNKLIEGNATVTGDKVILRQGALERSIPKADVLFVGQTRDEVYRFMLATVPATDPVARLSVAKWCLLSGLREQGLVEAREVLKLQPGNTAAADIARSLEESLRQFPSDGSVPRPPGGTLVAEPDLDVTPEGATTFASRAQPVLANQCVECHARPDHPGSFKLIRVTGFEAGPQSTRANLQATAKQLKKDDPLNSPLLTKALSPHGGMKQPAFANRQAGGFRVLEAWVLQAVGPGVPPMTPPAQPVFPSTPPVTPIPPATEVTMPATAAPAPQASTPILPPVETPAAVPPVLPTPPTIPPADTGSRTTSPTLPTIPAAPPSLPTIPVVPSAASVPTPPSNVQPVGSQFGAGAKPVVPPTGPTGGDEFDPAAFNRGTPPRK